VLSSLVLALILGSDWPAFAHDQQRTGFQPRSAITQTNVNTLALHWNVALSRLEPRKALFTASPIVANGIVYVCSRGGNVYALQQTDGKLLWHRHVGSDVRGTPLAANGRLIIGVYGIEPETGMPAGAAILSLDAATGRTIWRSALPGVVRSEPIVVDGVVYGATAGGDAIQGAINGRIVAIDERTGRQLDKTWYTSHVGHSGGGIWSPLSYDGTSIFFGTGNTTDGSGDEDSIVSITPAFRTRWAVHTKAPTGEDEDVGSGVMLRDGVAYCKGKSGNLYAIDVATGRPKFIVTVHPDSPGGGGFGTPTGDGDEVVASSGDGSADGPYTKLVAFDLTGKQIYDIALHELSTPSLQAAFVKGVGIAPVDRSLLAFGALTGKTLWQFPTASGFYGSPAIAGDAVYAVDLAGNVYALALNATAVHTESLLATNEVPNGGPPATPGRRWRLIGAGSAIGVVLLGAIAFELRRRRLRAR
jgi:outer membrane protein assembly factor BamB